METPKPDEQSLTVPQVSLVERIKYAALAFTLQNLIVGPGVIHEDVRDYLFPPASRPDVVKTYPARQNLPIRLVAKVQLGIITLLAQYSSTSLLRLSYC